MAPMPTSAPAQLDRDTAYTYPRQDVCSLVPGEALTVLDVGCSNGALGASLLRARPGRRVIGIERDAGFVREAATRLDAVIEANLEEFDWHTGLKGERFDCIVFADVLEHLREPAQHVRGALANLKPGGSIVISLPNIRHLSALVSIYAQGRFPRRNRGLFDATHMRWFTIADGRELLAENGLQIEAESYALRVGDVGGGPLNRVLQRLPLAVQTSAPVREFLTYQFSLRARLTQPPP